ncbi:hypothetical protein MK139_00890 [bacterium]|jgi:hypothetical protein|nr:hypothetical protein [bacterium]HCK09621.1 hypothetical protein [Candidatus Latescibacterota bacterium]
MMGRIVSVVLIATIVTLASVLHAHGLHLSIGKSEVVGKTFTGKLVFNKLDFIEALDQWNPDQPLYELDPEGFEKLTLRYMNRNFKVEANGLRDLKLEITEAGQDTDSLWLKFRFESTTALEQIRVEHRLLFAAFPGQGNVLEVRSRKGKQNHLFRVDSPAKVFKF